MFRWLLLYMLIFTSCTSSVPESNMQMAAELALIADETDQYPHRNAHVNRARARELKNMMPPADPSQRVQYDALLATELLRAGESEESAMILQGILDSMQAYPNVIDPSWQLAVMDHLALSYLRIGEQENCLINHTAARCLFPIDPAAVHSQRRGSEMAIHWYEQILDQDSTDLNALWLMNLAHMTLGSHPDGIDPKWFIPMESENSTNTIRRFTDLAPHAGVDVMGLSGGVVLEDLSGDGWLDLMVSSWGLQDPIQYFENNRNGGFDERTEEAGLAGLTGGLNLVHADYDNDGDQDVLVLRGAWLGEGHPNSLLRNDGRGRFEDVTREAGIYSRHPTQTAAWSDFDQDGDLDLLIGNETNPQAGRHPNELFVNQGDGTFVEAIQEYGLSWIGYTKAVVWGDYNNDGWPDLFVSRYRESNLLFQNQEGKVFTDVSDFAGIREPLDSFPAWFWDFDQDGWLDLFVSGWRATAGDLAAEFLGIPGTDEKPRLYQNLQDGTFEDVTEQAGLNKVMYTMGCNYGDLDGDGWLDFYVGTGDPNLRALMPNRMFRNRNGIQFEEVTTSGGFGHLQKGHGIAFGDVDHDGDQDVYQVMGGAFEGDLARNTLFENPGNSNEWVILSLEGTISNRSAVGARISVVTNADTLYRVVGTGASFGSSPLRVEIGLGKAESIDQIEIKWPVPGSVDTFRNIPMRQLIQFREGAAEFETISLKPARLGEIDD